MSSETDIEQADLSSTDEAATEDAPRTLVDIDSVRQLVQMMVDADLVEMTLRKGSEEVSLKRPGAADTAHVVVSAEPAAPTVPVAASPASAAPVDADADLVKIVSPMVGRFYAAPSPEAPPFVKIGDEVTPDSDVCIIEAMKVFNEIKAEVHGVIEKVYVQNEDPIEFGQPLFGVRRL